MSGGCREPKADAVTGESPLTLGKNRRKGLVSLGAHSIDIDEYLPFSVNEHSKR